MKIGGLYLKSSTGTKSRLTYNRFDKSFQPDLEIECKEDGVLEFDMKYLNTFYDKETHWRSLEMNFGRNSTGQY